MNGSARLSGWVPGNLPAHVRAFYNAPPFLTPVDFLCPTRFTFGWCGPRVPLDIQRTARPWLLADRSETGDNPVTEAVPWYCEAVQWRMMF